MRQSRQAFSSCAQFIQLEVWEQEMAEEVVVQDLSVHVPQLVSAR
jgi:hypothetical protein